MKADRWGVLSVEMSVDLSENETAAKKGDSLVADLVDCLVADLDL